MSLFSFTAYLHAHRALYWSVFCVLFGILLWDIVRSESQDRANPDVAQRGRDSMFAVLLAALLLWTRFPTWVWGELNPDEPQAIATAITFLKDPRFWLSVDAGTHGPLVSWPLLAGGLFGGRIDYVVSRCLGTLMLGGSIVLCFSLSCRWFSPLAARLATLPVTLGLGLTLFTDYVSYNGEFPLLLLLALGGWLLDSALRCQDARKARRLLIGAGAAIGLLPWVKLQGVPSVAAMVAIAAVVLRGRPRNDLIASGAGLLAPTALFGVYLTAIGALDEFFRSYIRFGAEYVAKNPLGLEERFWSQLSFLLNGTESDVFVRPVCFTLAFLLLGMSSHELRKYVQRGRLGIISLVLLAGVCEVYLPGNPFGHYLLLLVLPVMMLLAAALQPWLMATSSGVRTLILTAFAAATVFWPLKERLIAGTPITKIAEPDPREAMCRDILHYARPGDRLVVWGWMAGFHVLTQLPQGVRYAVMWQLSNATDEFLTNFVADFDATRPMFLDVVGVSFFFSDRKTAGHERFPAVVERIQRDYDLAFDQYGFRLFVRRDRLAELRAR